MKKTLKIFEAEILEDKEDFLILLNNKKYEEFSKIIKNNKIIQENYFKQFN